MYETVYPERVISLSPYAPSRVLPWPTKRFEMAHRNEQSNQKQSWRSRDNLQVAAG
jgi:hypothetical protein